MSNLVFTESSDDAVWDFEDDATRWVDNCPDLTHAEEMEGAVRGYRAGAAASEARIRVLKEALRDIAKGDVCVCDLRDVRDRTLQSIALAALKEDDQ